MERVMTAVTTQPRPGQVHLTIPEGSRLRSGGPFYNNMSAQVVGPDPDSETHMLVKVDGVQLRWPKANVHST